MSIITPEHLFDAGTRLDPYPVYSALREQGDGIHFVEATNAWMVMRFEEVSACIKDRGRLSSDLMNSTMGFGAHDADDPVHARYAPVARHNLAASDPPAHPRLRGLVGHAFTARAMQAWSAAVTDVTSTMLDSLEPGTEIDAVRDLADVLPVEIIATVIGVPIEDRARFRRLSVAFTETFDPTIMGEPRDRAIRDSVELFDYVDALAEERVKDPRDDLLGTLIRAEEDATRLSHDELVAMVCMLLVAGNETTADTIASGLVLLTAAPERLDELRRNPDLVDPAVLEILRLESPLQFTGRVATEQFELGDHVVETGQLVFPCMGSANRDPRQFDDPESFDLTRKGGRHLAFGIGPHFCVGNQLARLEATTFFQSLLERFPVIEAGSAEPEIRSDRFFQRGYRSVPLTLA